MSAYAEQKRQDTIFTCLVILCVVVLILCAIGIASWIMPQYNVWRKELAGKAALREAEWDRQIEVLEAQAKKDSATMLAEAEVLRAEGVAAANAIIGESLKDSEAYLRYLWIQGLNDSTGEVIYVPTEANLPILEAVRSLPKGE
jgi:hypothetical protein